MDYVLIVLTSLVAIEHIYFLYLEMFLWTKPKGLRIFGLSAEKAAITRGLAANQGLYNGFLAAGLIWGLFYPDKLVGTQIQLFFLICVLVAAVFGGLTVKRSILYIQGLPAALAIMALLFI
ncbi:MAG: DUF1304 domain-containing protein [Gammaproteobacteria bacterium]|nr:DUF1304 domain-containing protein [Gammaproteobacteria bacterium]